MCRVLGHPRWQTLSLGSGMASSYCRATGACAGATAGVGALGCSCSLLLLLCLWRPHFSSGQGSPPVCHYWRTAQLQPCGAPADSRGSVPACSQGTRWPLGLHPSPFPSHSGNWRGTAVPWSPAVVQVPLAVVLDWSAAGPDPATTRLNDVPSLLGLWMRPEHEGQEQHYAGVIHFATILPKNTAR